MDLHPIECPTAVELDLDPVSASTTPKAEAAAATSVLPQMSLEIVAAAPDAELPASPTFATAPDCIPRCCGAATLVAIAVVAVAAVAADLSTSDGEWGGPWDVCYAVIPRNGTEAITLYGEAAGGNGTIEVDVCYCEKLDAAPVRQRGNAYSNVGYLLGGVVVALMADYRRRRPRVNLAASRQGLTDLAASSDGLTAAHGPGDVVAAIPSNPFAAGSWEMILYGGVLFGASLSSAAFHASMKKWPGVLDSAFVGSLIIVIFFYDLQQLTRRRYVWAFAALSWVIVMALMLVFPDYSGIFAVVFSGPAYVCEVLIAGRCTRIRRAVGPHLVVLMVQPIALVVWLLGKSHGPLCVSQSPVGHILWHLGSAVTLAGLPIAFATEFEPPKHR